MRDEPLLSQEKIARSQTRQLEVMTLQDMQGNPLTHDDIGMFEMFEREGWPHKRCLA